MKLNRGSLPGVCLPVIISALPVHGGSLYWDGGSAGPDAEGGAGIWSAAASPANWDSSATGGSDVGWTDGSDAVFGGTGSIVTVSGTVSVSSLGFTSAGYQLMGGLVSLTGAPVIDVGVNDVTLWSVIAGTSPIVKEGSGKLTLSGANTYTGSTTVNAGTLRVDASGSLASPAVAISSGAAVTYHNTTPTGLDLESAFSGSGGLNFSSTNDGSNGLGTFRLNGDNSGFTGPVTVSDARISLSTGKQVGSGTITFNGRAALSATNVTVPNALVLNTTNRWGGGLSGTLFPIGATFSGPITLPGGVYTVVHIPGSFVSHSTISGPIGQVGGKGRLQIYAEFPGSTLTLSGDSTYSGETIIDSQGTLNLTGSLGSSQVFVSNGGTLAGNGVIGQGGSLYVSGGGRIRAGTRGGGLTVYGNVNLASNTVVDIDVKPGPAVTTPIPVLNYAGNLVGTTANLNIGFTTPYRKAVFAITPTQITVDIGSKELVWKGAPASVWSNDYGLQWAIPGGGVVSEAFFRGDSVLFDDSGPGGSVGAGTAVEPSAVVVNNSAKNYQIFSQIIGACTVDKHGTADLILGSANHTGGTTAHAGSVSIKGSGPVTIAAPATLRGSAITGPVNVAGTIDPGGVVGGSARGILTTGPLTLSGSYDCEMFASFSDEIVVSGNLDLTGSTLTLSQAVEGTPTSYVIATYTGTLTGMFGSVTGVPEGYVLRYENAAKRIVVTRPGFPEWAVGYPGVSDLSSDGDPDGDGIVNLMEYVVGGDPGVRNVTPSTSTFSWLTNPMYLEYFYRRSVSSRSSTTQVVQWSADLKTWTDIPIPQTSAMPTVHVAPLAGGMEFISVNIPRVAGGKMYVRLKVMEL